MCHTQGSCSSASGPTQSWYIFHLAPRSSSLNFKTKIQRRNLYKICTPRSGPVWIWREQMLRWIIYSISPKLFVCTMKSFFLVVPRRIIVSTDATIRLQTTWWYSSGSRRFLSIVIPPDWWIEPTQHTLAKKMKTHLVSIFGIRCLWYHQTETSCNYDEEPTALAFPVPFLFCPHNWTFCRRCSDFLCM